MVFDDNRKQYQGIDPVELVRQNLTYYSASDPFTVRSREIRTGPNTTVDDIARVLCMENYDATHMSAAISQGLRGMRNADSKESRNGERLTRLIHKYFVGNGVTFKWLVAHPPMTSVGQDLRELTRDFNTMVDNFNALPEATQRELTTIAYFLNGVKNGLEGDHPNNRLVIVAPEELYANPVTTKVVDDRSRFIDWVIQPKESEPHPRFHEHVLERLQEMSAHRVPGVIDAYTGQVNGVSLQQLTSIKNQDQFVSAALRFLTGFPRGDMFWQYVVESLFFYVPQEEVWAGRMYQNPTFTDNLYQFQRHLVRKLFEPALLGVRPDGNFDRTFERVMQGLSLPMLDEVVTVLFDTATHPFRSVDAVRPGNSPHMVVADPSRVFPIYSLLPKARVIEHSLWDFWKTRVDEVGANFQARFGKHQWANGVLQGWVNAMRDYDFRSKHTQEMCGHLEKIADPGVYGRYVRDGEALAHIASELPVVLAEEVRGLKIEGTFAFPQGSLPHKLGFHYMDVDVGENPSVFLLSVGGKYAIDAKLTEEGEFETTSFAQDEERRSFTEVVRQIAIAVVAEAKIQKAAAPKVEEPSTPRSSGLSPKEADEALRSYLLEN